MSLSVILELKSWCMNFCHLSTKCFHWLYKKKDEEVLVVQVQIYLLYLHGVVTSSYNSYKGNKDKPLCTYCGFYGHTIDKCYKKHGYPPGFKPKGYNANDSHKGQFGNHSP